MNTADSILDRLEATLGQRRMQMPEGSYTTKLMQGGVPAIGKKISEEAAEVIEAAGEEGDAGKEHLVHEAADLIYHLLVMLAYREVTLDEVRTKLAAREGTSGLQEKASRQKS